MNTNSASSQISKGGKLLYSFSSISFSEVEDDCLNDDKMPDISSLFINKSLNSVAEKQVATSKSDSYEEFFKEAINSDNLSCPIFKTRLIGGLMTENGSKQIQKNMSKYSQSCFAGVYSIVSSCFIYIT